MYQVHKMKEKINLEKIANFYSEYRKKFDYCIAKKRCLGEDYCSLNLFGKKYLSCPYAKSDKMIRVKKNYHYRCTYKKGDKPE